MGIDTGRFQINDLTFQVPPEAIKVNRRAVNNYWQTLRTRSSIKLASGYSLLDIEVSMKVLANHTELQKLSALIAQLRVTPFCYVDNQYIRNTVLGGTPGQTMVLALKQFEMRKSAGEDTDVIEVYMLFAWFNYFPYMKDWLYKEDIFVPKAVRDPRKSQAWRIMYAAEMMRGNYEVPVGLQSNAILDLRQFMNVAKKKYKQLKEDILFLKEFRSRLENFPPKEESSELPGAVEQVVDSMIQSAGRDQVLRSLESVCGHSTTAFQDIEVQELLNLIDVDITEKNETIESYGKIYEATTRGWEATKLVDGTPLEGISRLDVTVDDKDKDLVTGSDNQILMESNRVLNFAEADLIITGVSISFENILATMPVIGHPYPSFQHIGSVDAVVTLSFVTTSEASVQAISSFYTICEDQARKFKQVPSGIRNVKVRNDIVNMCGLHEFLVEDLRQGTMPGQPGTYYGELVLVNNPIDSETREALTISSDFITSNALRLKVMEILDRYVSFNLEEVRTTIFDPRGRLAKAFDLPSIGRSGEITEKLLPSPYWTIGGEIQGKKQFRGSTVITPHGAKGSLEDQGFGDFPTSNSYYIDKKDPNRISGAGYYSFNNTFDEREAGLRYFVVRYMNLLTSAFSGISSMFIPQWLNQGGDLNQGFDAISLLTLVDDEVLGIGRLRKDLIQTARQFKSNGRIALFAKSNPSDPDSIESFGQLDQFIYDSWNEMKDLPIKDQRKKVAAIFERVEELTKDLGMRGTMTPDAHYRRFLKNRDAFVREYLRDFQQGMLELLDELQRSHVFDLDIFEPVKKMYKETGLPSIGNNYPDFPLKQIISILQQREDWKEIESMLLSGRELEGLASYNVSLDSLINPDFYLYNKTTDSVSEIIGRPLVNQAKEAIKLTHSGDVRGKAEEDWITKVYETQILGKVRAERIRDDVVHGTTVDDRRGKLEEELKKLKEDPAKQEFAREVEARINALQESSWYPYDLQGPPLGNAISENVMDGSDVPGGVEVKPINNLEDKANVTMSFRDETQLIPDPERYAAAQHRWDVVSCLDELPPAEYRFPSTTFDQNKDPEWTWPVSDPDPDSAPISNDFGEYRQVATDRRHMGVDIGVSCPGCSKASSRQKRFRTYITAAAEGKIVKITKDFVQYKTKYSHPMLKDKYKETTVAITLEHANGWKTVYKHLQWNEEVFQRLHYLFYSKSGDQEVWVQQGQALGKMGSTGYSTGPHLHFEMIKRGKKPLGVKTIGNHCDPYAILKQGGISVDQGPVFGIDPNNESLFTKSLEQFEKEMQNGQGYSLMRAYPTFRLYFIESDLEERKVFGFDDFFSYSAVQDIQIIRSRKIAADLMVVTLTNTSGVLTNRKFRGQGRENEFRDPKGKIVKEDPYDVSALNTVRENPVASMMVQPGMQVQMRLGYHSSPDELERVFNGIITDVNMSQDEDIVEITCQSFGIELTQKIYGEAKKYGGFWRSSGKTSEILEDLMAQPEMVHFGRWERKDSTGPANIAYGLLQTRFQFVPTPQDDNLFPPTGNKAFFGLFDSSPNYVMYNTTVWDTFQEMTLRHPAYVTYPVPYDGLNGPRMTMFFGVPNQLYFARDPTQREQESYRKLNSLATKSSSVIEQISDGQKSNSALPDTAIAAVAAVGVSVAFPPLLPIAALGLGTLAASGNSDKLKEIWVNRALLRYAKNRGFIKPFRNYHVLTSTMHIIKNSITSSSWNTFNTVTLNYEDDCPEIGKETKSLVFNEKESFTLKCDAGVPDEEIRELMSSWPNCIGEEMAKRYGVGLLWNSLKEGYSGAIITIGNPSIKPHDVCYVLDEYNDMVGPIEVEQVIHRFSQNTGFVTEITPDMCIHVNQASTMATDDAVGLAVEGGLKEMGLAPLASVIGAARGSRTAGLARVGGIDPDAGITASNVATDMAVSAIKTAVTSPFSPLAAGLWAPTLVGTFILRKLVSRSQLAHPFRYSPLVKQGKPMIGGMPSRYVDGSFIQGIDRWFKETSESIPLYMEHLYDKIVVNEWVHPRGKIGG